MNTVSRKNTKALALIGALTLASLFAFGSTGRVQTASAMGTMALSCADSSSSNVNQTTVSLNTIVQCHTHDTNPMVNAAHFWVTGPNGVIANTGIIPYTPGQDIKYVWQANVPGTWTVDAVYYDKDGHQFHVTCSLGVTFFVLPESSIGAIAIMGSSMAALGAFVGLRKLKTTPQKAAQ